MLDLHGGAEPGRKDGHRLVSRERAQFSIWVMNDAGLLKQEGLDMELVYIAAPRP